jgi:hypothetical protein
MWVINELLIKITPEFIMWDEDIKENDPFGIIQKMQNTVMQRSVKKLQLFRKTRIHLEKQMARNNNNKRNFAASKIQKKWRHVVSNPNTSICRKRLLSEFTQLSGDDARWVQHHHGCWRRQ